MIAVSGSIKELNSEWENLDIIYPLLSPVIIDTKDLLFLVWLKGLLKLARAPQILLERFLHRSIYWDSGLQGVAEKLPQSHWSLLVCMSSYENFERYETLYQV